MSAIKMRNSRKYQRLNSLEKRSLRCEPLEDRLLLSVSQAEYETIRAVSPDDWLPELSSELNIADLRNVTAESLQNAVVEAMASPEDDLIVLRLGERNELSFSETIRIETGISDPGALTVVGIDDAGNVFALEEIVSQDAYFVGGDIYFNGDYYFSVPETDQEISNSDDLLPQMIESKPLINYDAYLNDERFADLKGAGFSTVIIDTGIYAAHNEFTDRIVYQWDFADNDDDANDVNSHGTHVAGIAAGSTYGIASEAGIIVLKVFSDNGGGASSATLKKALQWVIDNGETYHVASVNMSMASAESAYRERVETVCHSELATLGEMGITTCISSGNYYDTLDYKKDDPLGVSFPACDPACISVGATWDGSYTFYSRGGSGKSQPNELTYFSQRDPLAMDIAAPGARITSAGISSPTATSEKNGTSMSAPIVSGAIVLAQSVAQEFLGRSLSAEEIRTLLRNTATVRYDAETDDTVTNMEAYYYLIDIYAMADTIYQMAAVQKADLTVGVESGWNYGAVVATSPDAKVSASLLSNKEDVYVNFSVLNLSCIDVTGPFSVTAVLSGPTSAARSYSFDSLAAMAFANTSGDAWNLGRLAIGDYTLTINVDAGGEIDESKEENNSFSMTFSVAAVPEKVSTIVTTTEDVVDAYDGLISLREAIDYASAGETITFDASVFSGGETITLNADWGELVIVKSLTIDASALDGGVILRGSSDESAYFRVMSIEGDTSDVSLIGLTITQGGALYHGGGIYHYGKSLTLTDCIVTENKVVGAGDTSTETGYFAKGGGIYATGKLTLIRTTVSNNTASEEVKSVDAYGGGICVEGNQLTLTNAQILNNQALSGGGIYYYGQVETINITDSLIDGNQALRGGGAYFSGGNVTVQGTTITNNVAGKDGGGLYLCRQLFSFTDSIISKNTALTYGGGIWTSGSSLSLCSCNVNENTVTGGSLAMGGGIYASGDLTLVETEVAWNNAVGTDETVLAGGGGIYVYNADLTIFKSAFLGNQSVNGGGIYYDGLNSSHSMSLAQSSISANQGAYGGGIYHGGGTMAIDDSLINGNDVTDNGGGIYVCQCSFTITDSKIMGNKALRYGGGIASLSVSEGRLTNVLIAKNRADYGGGIGIYFAQWDLINVTITANRADQRSCSMGGGISLYGESDRPYEFNLYNSIIVDNMAYDGSYSADVATMMEGKINGYNVLSGFNRWSNADTETATQYVYDSALPLFKDASMSDWTLALNSQAFNKGDNSWAVDEAGDPIEQDLAGNTRILQGIVDLGAYEYKIALAAPTVFTSEGINLSQTKVSWNTVENAVGYTLEYALDSAFTDSQIVDSLTETEYLLTGLTRGTTYYFRVKSIGREEYDDSDYSETQSFKSLDGSDLKVTLSERSPIPGTLITTTLSFTVADPRYQWFRVDGEGNETAIAGATGWRYKVKQADKGYYLKVKVTSRDSSLGIASEASTRSAVRLSTPSISLIKLNGSNVNIIWHAIDGADSYTVLYAFNPGFVNVQTATSTTNNLLLTDMPMGETIYAMMKANSEAYGGSSMSGIKYATINKLMKSEITSLKSSGSSLTVTWELVENADRYVVYYSQDASFVSYKTVISNSATVNSTTINNMAMNTPYYVKIQARRVDGTFVTSEFSNVHRVVLNKLAAPKIQSIEIDPLDSTKILVTWDLVENASRYVCYYGTDPDFVSASFKGSVGNSLEITDLTPGATYYFRVQARDSQGIFKTSDYSAVESMIIPEIAFAEEEEEEWNWDELWEDFGETAEIAAIDWNLWDE